MDRNTIRILKKTVSQTKLFRFSERCSDSATRYNGYMTFMTK